MKKTRSSSSQQRSASSNAGLDDDGNESWSGTEGGSNAVRGKKRKAQTSTAERNTKRQRKTSSIGTA